MSQYSLLVNRELCFNCHTCEVACKQEHDVPLGVNWIRVITVGPREVNGKLALDFIPMTCRHCLKAPCIEVCPVEGALVKLLNGAVIVESSLCIGCMACADACPFHVIVADPVKQVAAKCNLCLHLIEKGLKPSCVKHCPSGCLQFGETNEIIAQRRFQKGQKIADALI